MKRTSVWNMKKNLVFTFLLLSTIFTVVVSVHAETPFKIKARAAVVINSVSGQVVFAQEPDREIPPASLTKLMTLYIAFDAIDEGHVSLDDDVRISRKSWLTGGSKMFLEVGSSVPLETLLKGIAVVSANDACVAVAEHIAGVEEVFVEKMNKKAAAIGLNNSVFKNSHGLPCKGQYVTTKDMAMLAYNYIKDHPQVLKIHSVKQMTYNNITQRNRNGLLWLDNGVDGLKTGWFSSAGFHIVATAHRNGDRFIAVVMGAHDQKDRENAAMKLINYAFRNFKTINIKDNETHAVAHVRYGSEGSVPIAPPCHEINITVPIDGIHYAVEMKFPENIYAPVRQGQRIGDLRVVSNGNVLKEFPLVALKPVEACGFIKKVFQAGMFFFLSPPYIGLLVGLLILSILIFLRLVFMRRKKDKKKRKDVISDL